jgi:transposase
MSLHPQVAYCVPEETKRVAEAAFPQRNPYMRVADMLGTLDQDEQFAELFPTRGQPALSPARLALCTVLQFAEGLSDRQAADAVRGRIDWKYVLCLDLVDAGFHHTVLSEFRSRLVQGDLVDSLLNTFLDRAKQHGLLASRGRQRTDSTHILGAIRLLNRLERMGETLRHALNTLAVCVPQWLKRQAPPAWYERYSKRMEHYQFPKTESALHAFAITIGEDGYSLLSAIDQDGDHDWLNELPTIQTLRRIWADHYTAPPEPVAWRPLKELVPADSMVSPYDTEARFCTKRDLQWVGYKVHLAETCEPDQPHLITHVDTTPSTTHDDQRLEPIHTALAAKGYLPREHLVDRGYTTADTIITSKQHHGVTLVGPIVGDTSWQVREQTGFDKAAFTIDWDRQQVTCP